MLAISTLTHELQDGGAFTMVHVIYHFIDFQLLTPAAIATLLTGLIYPSFTGWDFSNTDG